MTDIAKLTVALYANSAQFVSELNKSRKQATKWGADVGQSFANGAKTVATSSLAIAGSAAAIGYAVKASLDNIDEMTRLAGNLSIPVERFQELSYAAKLSGSEMDKVADVIKDISVRVQDAAFSGGGPMVDFFTQINQKASDWAQLRPDQQFERFVAEINKMDANQARFWLDEINDSATELFGVLYGSGAAFGKFESEARGVGLAVSTDMTGNVKEARVEFDRLLQLGSATWKNVIAASSPAFTYVIKGINQWIVGAAKANGGFSGLGQNLAVYVIDGVERATHAVQGLYDSLSEGAAKMAASFSSETRLPYLAAQSALNNARGAYLRAVDKYDNANAEERAQMDGQIESLGMAWQRAQSKVTAIIGTSKSDWTSFYETLDKLRKSVLSDDVAPDLLGGKPLTAPASPDTPGGKGKPNNLAATQALAELKKNLQTQREQVEATYQSQLQTISNYYGSEVDTSKEAKSLIEKAEAQHQKALADLEKNGPFGQLKESLKTQEQLIKESYDRRLQIIKDHYGASFQSSEEASSLVDSLNQQTTKQLRDANVERLKNSDDFWEQMQGQILSTTDNFDAMWGNAFGSFTQGIGDSVAEAVMEQKSLSDSMKAVLSSVLQQTISTLVQIGTQRLVLWGVEKMIGTSSAAGYAGTVAAQGQAQAFLAAENAFAATAAIPIIGPGLAPGAAAAALTAAQSFAAAATTAATAGGLAGMAHNGIDQIPSEGTWLLDKGERVYTNDSANRIDSMYNRVMSMQQQSAAPAVAGGGTTLVQVSTVDAQGFEKMLRRNKRALERQNKRIANDRGRRATARG